MRGPEGVRDLAGEEVEANETQGEEKLLCLGVGAADKIYIYFLLFHFFGTQEYWSFIIIQCM